MQRRKKRRTAQRLPALSILVLLPLLVTVTMQNMQLNRLLDGIGQAESMGTAGGSGTAEPDSGEGMAEELLIRIVAKEMDAGFSEEALKAQSVIARTNYLDAEKKGAKTPEAMPTEEMQKAFGTDFPAVYEKLKACVNATAGETLMWQDDYIYAAYHAVSSGMTRKIEDLYQDVHMPYLTGIQCHDDTGAEGYLAVCFWKKEEFLEMVNRAFPDGKVQDTSAVQVAERDAAEYVLKVQVGELQCGGEEFRSAFGLNSACFTITDTGENIRIVTKGIGHGFGLSQHMAESLAAEGKDYREILAYFFPEATLEKAEKNN